MGNGFFIGEIHSGERWGTDETPTEIRPEILSILLEPRSVVAKGLVFIQVFVHDVPMPIE